MRSSNNSFTALQFGQAGDIPQPADYVGDARADVAVYRSGNWYILNSGSNSLSTINFGLPADVPVISPRP